LSGSFVGVLTHLFADAALLPMLLADAALSRSDAQRAPASVPPPQNRKHNDKTRPTGWTNWFIS
jgi:hypothetical protein